MTALFAILMMGALNIKHFIFDFLYQPPRMFENKGYYGRWGGIEHAGWHMWATMFILFAFGLGGWLVAGICVAEFVIHYHMDWFKMKYNRYKGWGPLTHSQYWVLLGVDQFVHSMTYVGIVLAILLI